MGNVLNTVQALIPFKERDRSLSKLHVQMEGNFGVGKKKK